MCNVLTILSMMDVNIRWLSRSYNSLACKVASKSCNQGNFCECNFLILIKMFSQKKKGKIMSMPDNISYLLF